MKKSQDFRLSMRITAAVLFMLAAGALTWMLVENAHIREIYIGERGVHLDRALHGEELRLRQSVDTLRQDVLFLSNLPPVSGIIRAIQNHGYDPRDGNSRETWEARLKEIFSAFTRAHPDYYCISYIGLAGDGHELVRVDNRGGQIVAAPAADLRSRAGRDYFKAVLGMREGQVWLSDVLAAAVPGESRAYTLLAATPVYAASGKLFGMLIVRMDMSEQLRSATAGLPPDVQTYIADTNGQYLLRSDPSLSGMSGLVADFPSLGAMMARQAADFQPLRDVDTARGRQYLTAGRIHFDPAQPGHFLLLAYDIPEELILRHAPSLPMRQIVGGIVAMLLAGAFAILLLRRVLAPLQQVTLAADRIIAGDRNVRLPQNQGGEVGTLSGAFNAMLDKLSQQEDAFRKELAESLPGIFYMIDASGHFLMWNGNLETVLHCSAEEIARSHPLDFFDGEDVARIEAAIRQVFEQGEAYIDATLVAKNGERTSYHFTGRRIIRHGEPVLVGLGLDVSAQQQILHETRTLLRRNQALLKNSMEGIHIMDMDGDIVDVNDAFCAMLGYTREEALRLNVRDWNAELSSEVLRERFETIVGNSLRVETVHRRKDGSTFHVDVTAYGIEIDGRNYVYAASRDISAHKEAERALLRYKQVIDTSLDGFWATDEQGRLIDANQAYARMSGYAVDELIGMHVSQIEAEERPQDVAAHIDKVRRLGHDRFETRHRRKDGQEFDVEVSVTSVPQSQQFFVFSRDITERRRAEQELRVAAVAFETHDAILITDARANIIRVNQAFTDITGYGAEEVLGKNPRVMGSGRQDKAFYIEMWQQLLHTGSWAGEIYDKRRNGQIYPKWLTITAVRNGRGEITHYVGIFSDITARKRAEDEIRNLAFYDALTRLPNRRLFMDRFRAALTISTRRNDYGAVLFIDLDRFKTLNDTLGHDYGDLLLVEVAARIKSCVREMDTVARLGGDEFVVLVEGISDDEDEASRHAGLIAEKIREALAHPYKLKNHEHHSSPSIGISLYRGHDKTVDEVLQQSDMAMYQAKGAGRNAVRFFDPVMQHNVATRAELENELHHAIALGQLQLHYQVQVDGEHRPVGAEALLRWFHPQRGLILPGQFIQIAEESTLILDIGHWVLDQACHQLALWAGSEHTRGLTLAVNVSAKQFAQPNFVDRVAEAVRKHGVMPSRLKLELTESLVLDDLKSTAGKMHALKELGVKLSMDDFGTGYSSLAYLKHLPLDQVKIDQGFIHGITQNGNDALLVKAIIDLACNFRMHVIAEGVETEAQMAFLKDNDCMAYQGYLFSEPVPADEFEKRLTGMSVN